ncbi:MAG: MFS transporter, partial [Planctomycetes bacterium]|nr:MFS transporter [Planctomycetota bacterium]
TQKPTGVRHGVIAFAVGLAVITYIDRVCISQAAPLITRDLNLSKIEMGAVFSAFTLAYALFEIPGGWLGDRFGARTVLTRIVIWWSFFTAATGRAWSQLSLIVIRFLFGAGEAGCFPNIARAFSVWLPPAERARAQSLLWICTRWAGAFTPVLVVLILRIQGMTWRGAFYLFGVIGAAWAVAFWLWYRDDPMSHPKTNDAERRILKENAHLTGGHGDVPWGRFLGARTTWLIWLQYFCFSWAWYFYITWFPTYLKMKYPEMNPLLRALLAGFPLFMGGIGSFCTAASTSWLVRLTGSLTRTRRMMAGNGFAIAAIVMLVPTRIDDPVLVIGALGLASFLCDFVIPVSWSTCIDVGGRFAGTFSGSMNMMGNLGGAFGSYVVGSLLQKYHDFNVAFYMSSGVFALGAVCWIFIDPVTSMDTAAATRAARTQPKPA